MVSHAFPEVVRNENTLRPDHVSDDVCAAGDAHGRDHQTDGQGEIELLLDHEVDLFDQSRHIGNRGIADADILRKAAFRTVKRHRVVQDQHQKRHQQTEQQHEYVYEKQFAEPALENIPEQFPAVAGQRGAGVAFRLFRPHDQPVYKSAFFLFSHFFLLAKDLPLNFNWYLFYTKFKIFSNKNDIVPKKNFTFFLRNDNISLI